LIVQVCDELLAGQHLKMFPFARVDDGQRTQFNMNVNEVISNRCCQLAGTAPGSKAPVHPNDHVNMSQSSNDSFPSAMYIAAAVEVVRRLAPAVLITALAPVIGYDKASKTAHHAMDRDLTLRAAALQLGFVSEEEFDRVADPAKMVRPHVVT
jgi:fumarate hydratase class II